MLPPCSFNTGVPYFPNNKNSNMNIQIEIHAKDNLVEAKVIIHA